MQNISKKKKNRAKKRQIKKKSPLDMGFDGDARISFHFSTWLVGYSLSANHLQNVASHSILWLSFITFSFSFFPTHRMKSILNVFVSECFYVHDEHEKKNRSFFCRLNFHTESICSTWSTESTESTASITVLYHLPSAAK